MPHESRVNNSIKNIAMNIAFQVFIIILNFASRLVFVNQLNAEYLGINGLFSNILGVLSLGELGVSGAIMYSMYKPMRENDASKLCALTNFYGKIYKVIALLVAILGLLLVPFLQVIVQSGIRHSHIVVYYLMFLLCSVTSYLFSYRTIVISVAQKDYALKKYSMLFSVVRFALQIIALSVFKSFFLYTLTQIIVTLSNNYYNSHKATQWFPAIAGNAELEKSEKKQILRRIRSMLLFNVGDIALNNTDNILISVLVNTAVVGLYSNYTLLFTTVGTAVGLVFSGVHSSVGNLNAGTDRKAKEFIFQVLNVMSCWIYGFCSICFLVLTQDFICIAFSDAYLLGNETVLACVINFYLVGALFPIINYRTTIGLFHDSKYIMLIAAVINLVVSVWLGIKWGLFGILIATSISRLATNTWFEPYILFKKYFKQSAYSFLASHIKNAFVIIFFATVITGAFELIKISSGYLAFICKGIFCAVVPNIFYFWYYRKTKEFKYLLNIAKRKISELKSKRDKMGD